MALPKPLPPPPNSLESIGEKGWRTVDLELRVVALERGYLWVEVSGGPGQWVVWLPHLMVDHEPFDGVPKRPMQRKVKLSMPRWLAQDKGLLQEVRHG